MEEQRSKPEVCDANRDGHQGEATARAAEGEGVRAMDKIRDEMAKAAGDMGICALGEWLTERLQREPGIAPKILQKDKTLAGAFGKIREYARKIAKGGAACVADAKAFEIAGEYFGIPATPREAPKPQALAPAGIDALDLDALLGD